MPSISNMMKPKHILLVESARGAAAVYVCLHHITLIGHLADSFKWGKFVFYPFSYGEEMVSLFFFLSGFSIHYSSFNRPLNTMGGIWHYYYLRLRRIYPIFLVAVGLTLILGVCCSLLDTTSASSYIPGDKSLLYVLTFLSDWHPGSWNAGLPNNPALWSLSYEIPYYLLYPIFWRAFRKFGPVWAFVTSLCGSGIFVLVDCIHSNHISNVLSLYWLWTAGALMADWKLNNKMFTLSPVPYYLLLFVSFAISQSTEAIVKPVVHPALSALTIGLIIFSTFVNFRPILFSMRLFAVTGLLFLLALFHIAARNIPTWGHHVFLDVRLLFCAAALSWFLFSGNNIAFLCRSIARPFLKAGAISYATYVIHMPILYFAADVLHHFNYSCLYLPGAMLIIFPLAWWLEIRFQSGIASFMDSSRAKLIGMVQPAPSSIN
jgi:peptidoglycan/LPS O-acetylase OafA/YrhL